MKNCNEVVNGKLGSSRPCGLLAPSYTLIICYTACFVSEPHQVKSELVHMNSTFSTLPLISLSPSLSFTPFQCVCAHVCMCQSAKTPWGNWAFATPPFSQMWRDSKYQCSRWGRCSLSASLPYTGRAEQMDSHQQQQESPQAKTGVEDTGTGLLLRRAILQTNSPLVKCTTL